MHREKGISAPRCYFLFFQKGSVKSCGYVSGKIRADG